MLLVTKPEHEHEVKKIFDKWDLHAITIGEVNGSDRVQISYQGELKADVPVETLVLGGGAPVYQRESKIPAYIKEVRAFDPQSLSLPKDYNKVLLDLLSSPTVSSKRWVYQQYDSMVRTNTVPTSSDAAVVRIKGTKKGISLKTDGNGRYVYLNPRRGGQIAVAEAARNVVCTGATPVAITNCLNFGNPYDREIYWQFQEAVAGIGEACRALDTPVTGGNVSFYNESPEGAVLPTPVIGMLGLLEDADVALPSRFQHSGDVIVLLGRDSGELGGSEYLFKRTSKILGDAPQLDLRLEKSLQALCISLASDRLIRSAHDCAEGGLAVALTECLFESGPEFGARIDNLPDPDLRLDMALFGESQSRIVISVDPPNTPDVFKRSNAYEVYATRIGIVNRTGRIQICNNIDMSVSDAESAYDLAIPKALGEI
jgi:phosphoribosylformylglycinamidine synthase II